MSSLRTVWFQPAPAKRLAALRLLVGAYALGYLLVRFSHLITVASFSPQQFAPVGPVGILSAPLPTWMVIAAATAAVFAGVGFVAGWSYRITGPAFAVLFAWVTSYRNSWSMIYHTDNLLLLHVVVLGLVPAAADAWSLDARRRGSPHADAVGERWGWPIRLLVAVTVATYFIAGYTKLQRAGFDWITSDTLRYHIAYDNLRKAELGAAFSPIGAALASQRWIFPPFAAVSLALEIFAPLAMLGPRWGRLWAYGAWSFHVGVLAFMAILFHYPLFGFAYASFFRAERVVEAIVRVRWFRPRA